MEETAGLATPLMSVKQGRSKSRETRQSALSFTRRLNVIYHVVKSSRGDVLPGCTHRHCSLHSLKIEPSMADGARTDVSERRIQLTFLAKFDSLLDLLRRLPPTKVEQNVDALCEVCPDYADDLLGSVDQPSKLLKDETNGRDFLGCDYNRDGDSFR